MCHKTVLSVERLNYYQLDHLKLLACFIMKASSAHSINGMESLSNIDTQEVKLKKTCHNESLNNGLVKS
jgi:hypothetical protein